MKGNNRMPRDYDKIENDIAVTGFFSEYLPPCFKLDHKVFSYPPVEKCDLIAPVCFTMSRYNGNDSRRNIFIPEIGSYIVTQQYIKQENIIQELIEFSQKDNLSFSPILGENDSIVRHEQIYGGKLTSELDGISSNYIENIAQKIIRSEGAKHVLKLDISNCFSSFYMHMIPAIMLGVKDAENEYNKYTKDSNDSTIEEQYVKYRELDSIVRRQNLNRTNGLLTGPLYSKIIAEAMFTRIDKELVESGIKFSRYVDDYDVYIYNNGEEKRDISIFEKTLKRYGFTLNSEKTELVEFPYYVAENLEQLFQEQSKEKLNDTETMNLFNSFFTLEKSGTKGAIRYLLKSIEKEPIDTTNPDLYKSYILTILGNNERSLTKACLLLINNKDTLTLSDSNVKFIINLLKSHLKYGHDLEVIWLFYLLIKTDKITKGDSTVSLIADSHNELAQVLLLQKNLLSKDLLDNICDKATSWILLYELYASEHISEESFKKKLHLNKNLKMYQYFKNNHLHFCEF